MKKCICIIVIFLLILVVGFGIYKLVCMNDETGYDETGSFYKMGGSYNGYYIDINSKEPGHPDQDSMFSTYFSIKDEVNNTNDYEVKYKNIVVENIDSYYTNNDLNNIVINGKEFNYSIDEDNCTSTLYYRVPEEEALLIISVEGQPQFGPDGNYTNNLSPITKSLIESKELAGILNFTISKESH